MEKEKQGPYQVRRVQGGFQVVAGDGELGRPIDGKSIYKHKQSAYRKRKKLNEACRRIDEMVERDGAIIL